MSGATWAIGGYFGLEAGRGRAPAWVDTAIAVQSGRMALRLALPPPKSGAQLWLPRFFCPPVLAALAGSGWSLGRYRLDESLAPAEEFEPGPHDRIVLVDFFGLCGPAVREGLHRFGRERVIVDASMAFFTEPQPWVPTVYSPRKFVGLPDGGFLVGPAAGRPFAAADEAASRARSLHLLKRSADDVQGGRADFAAAETSLDTDATPTTMSRLTRHWFDGIDFEWVAERRRRNSQRLGEGLRRLGHAPIDPAGQAPLCLPVTGMPPAWWRPRLAERGIFCPRYWPGIDPAGAGPVERRLLDETTCLPIDQRYGDDAMDHLLATIDELGRYP